MVGLYTTRHQSVAEIIPELYFDDERWRGGGLRFSLNEQERLNLRLDVGAGVDSWGAYVGIAEAF